MRPVRVSEDIVPVSDFKAQAADWLKRVADTGQPVVITQNGKAAGVLISPSEFDRLSDRAGLLEAIDAGRRTPTRRRRQARRRDRHPDRLSLT